jgi:predicted 3-demethylubiquinone-9 3-methyltransferase (glyoxalase superfamily)
LQAESLGFGHGLGPDGQPAGGRNPQVRGQRDVLGQYLLGALRKFLDRVLPLELAGVDHPDAHEDQTLEVAGKGAKHVEHGVDAVLTVEFELNGQPFTALNGGPQFKFTEAISFQIMCETQEEIDDFWNKLGKGGDPSAQQCGWLKDKFGLSWQVVPVVLLDMMTDTDREKSDRAMEAMFQMKKLDIAGLERAYEGETAAGRR